MAFWRALFAALAETRGSRWLAVGTLLLFTGLFLVPDPILARPMFGPAPIEFDRVTRLIATLMAATLLSWPFAILSLWGTARTRIGASRPTLIAGAILVAIVDVLVWYACSRLAWPALAAKGSTVWWTVLIGVDPVSLLIKLDLFVRHAAVSLVYGRDWHDRFYQPIIPPKSGVQPPVSLASLAETSFAPPWMRGVVQYISSPEVFMYRCRPFRGLIFAMPLAIGWYEWYHGGWPLLGIFFGLTCAGAMGQVPAPPVGAPFPDDTQPIAADGADPVVVIGRGPTVDPVAQREMLRHLDACARHPNPVIRRQAVEGLVRIEAGAHVKLLVAAALRDDNRDVRQAALAALPRLSDATAAEAIQLLSDDADPVIRWQAREIRDRQMLRVTH